MKIEEIVEKKENRDNLLKTEMPQPVDKPVKTKNSNYYNYWFPLNRVYARLLCVLSIIIATFIAAKQKYEEDMAETFFITLVIEAILYVAGIWVYQGFKDNPKKTDDEKKL